MAKRKIPTIERLREILHYEPETGKLFWIQPRKGCSLYLEAGSWRNEQRYKRICIDGRGFSSHVIIWYYMTGKYPVREIDHINGNKLDNRWINLRQTDQQKNTWNRRRAKQYSSKYGTGVWITTEKRYAATIQGKYLGNYNTKEEAAEAYAKAAERMYGEYTNAKSNGLKITRRTRNIPRSDNTSGFVGVGRHQNKWRARYKGDWVGSGFDTPEQAYRAILKYKRTLRHDR